MTFPGALVPRQALTATQSLALQSRRSIGNAPAGLGMKGSVDAAETAVASLSTEDPVTFHMGHGALQNKKILFFFLQCRRQGPGHAKDNPVSWDFHSCRVLTGPRA